MKRDRFFYTCCAAIFLVLMVIGFRNYIFGGRLFNGSPINPAMLAAIVAHSSAVFAWFLLFFVQSLLIATQNRRLHMKLGWSVLVIASMIAVTGPVVAIRSTSLESITVFDWPAPSVSVGHAHRDCAIRDFRCHRSAQPHAATDSPSHDAVGQLVSDVRRHWPDPAG